MSEDEVLSFKISMLGPTRVGKTSIIASVLQGSQQLLVGTPVTMRTANAETARRIALNRQAMQGTLHSGELRPGSLQSTVEPSHYSLLLDPGVEGAGIRFDLLDYPGEWLDDIRRPGHRAQEWAACQQFIKDSSVLIVPVDAAVLMEASRKEYRTAWPSILTTGEVEDVAGEWAKTRKARPHEPALVIFAPVKCESYFADNGGWRDQSDELFRRFIEVYGGAITRIRGECGTVVMQYNPVDTLGCVELRSAEWVRDDHEIGGWRFAPTFALRATALSGPAKIQTKGVDDVLAALCKQLMEARRAEDSAAAINAAETYASARAYAERSEGFFKDMWLWASRQRANRQRIASGYGREADERRNRLEAIEKVVRDLAGHEPDRRVRGL